MTGINRSALYLLLAAGKVPMTTFGNGIGGDRDGCADTRTGYSFTVSDLTLPKSSSITITPVCIATI
jgi:hypothetical protein